MIRVHNIWKSYENIQVLKGLSLIVPTAKITVILGRSGVGKSVLLRQIAGLEYPDAGDIEIDGVNIVHVDVARRKQIIADFGMLFQNSALFDSMSIEDNVAFPLLYNGKFTITEPDMIHKMVAEALDNVGLDGYQKKFPSELSGGQRRRAALARLIIYKPHILLFDEPTSGLDPNTSHQITSLIKETQRTLHGTAIVVTHDIVSALSLGDYFAFHHDGRICITGNRETFFSSQNPLLIQFLKNALIPEEYINIFHNSKVRELS